MPKATPWIKIKAEYLQGATPKELAEKYQIAAKAISNKANKDKWKSKKEKIGEKIEIDINEKISQKASTAINILSDIMTNSDAKDSDRIAACKAILDISGLKTTKHDLDMKNLPVIIDDIKS